MKGLSIVLVNVLLSLFIVGQADAAIIDSTDIGGFRTFQDINTSRIWLDMNNFFNKSSTDMITAISAAGFTLAAKTDVQQLLNSLPLTGGEWPTYKSIMGDAPNRELIWGSYDDGGDANRLGWAYASNADPQWVFLDNQVGIDEIINSVTFPNLTDMNIWAYQQGGQAPIPEPASLSLLGLGLLGLAGMGKKRKA